MKFVPIRELRNNSGQVWKALEAKNELVLTANGKPIALMTPVNSENLEIELKAIRRSRAAQALDRIRQVSQKRGLDRMPMGDIEKIIVKTRRKRRLK